MMQSYFLANLQAASYILGKTTTCQFEKIEVYSIISDSISRIISSSLSCQYGWKIYTELYFTVKQDRPRLQDLGLKGTVHNSGEKLLIFDLIS